MKKRRILIILICFLAKLSSAENLISLDGEWEFYFEKTRQWYPATVPGVIHTDLLANDLIEDPYWENNEKKLQWIGEQGWRYRKAFYLNKNQLIDQNIELVFNGLDTYAEVKLNDELVLSANNMFCAWKIEVKKLLKEGENTLEVYFSSPIAHNRDKYTKYPYRLPSGNESEEPRVGSFTRKAAYHFGWDWGPRFLTCGIWRSVELHSWSYARITDVYCVTRKITKDKAKIMAQISVEVSTEKAKKLNLIVDGKQIAQKLQQGTNVINYEFDILDPQLWWCNGLGEAHLYQINVEVSKKKKIIDEKNQNYGIRTIELVNEKDSIGTSFYFKLNSNPVFMKGANYIPQDVFLPRVTEDQYHRLLDDVSDAHMNMLRVWGGGIYENDIFYDLCDQKGILVWQDFMFAGSMYPVDSVFKQNVANEVRQNIIRLRSHPSLALWCGNNEIEVAWKNWGWQQQYHYSPSDSTFLWNGYLEIFREMIPDLCQELDFSTSYTPTSPLSNWGKAENFNHNSMHYWGVWHGKEPFENFEKNVGRFMVEFGFQSFPSRSTIRKFASDTSQYLTSLTMKNRQKSYVGNNLISKHIEQYYPPPATFEEFVVLSQKTQAKALQMAIHSHINSQPHCMGTLFWQLNDCWPGPSWSVIDYYGRHKIAYDVVKHEFE